MAHMHRAQKQDDTVRATCTAALTRHCSRIHQGDDVHAFVQALEKHLWLHARKHQKVSKRTVYLQHCRRVIHNYTQPEDHASLVASRTPDDWIRLNAPEDHTALTRRRAKVTDAFKEHMLLVSTDRSLLQCSRCHKWQVTYHMRQTRSADEPMSCFCECRACGKKWKQ